MEFQVSHFILTSRIENQTIEWREEWWVINNDHPQLNGLGAYVCSCMHMRMPTITVEKGRYLGT